MNPLPPTHNPLNPPQQPQSPLVQPAQVPAASLVTEIMSRDQDHHEERLDDAGRDITQQLPRQAPAHGARADDEPDDGDDAEDNGVLVGANSAHTEGDALR